MKQKLHFFFTRLILSFIFILPVIIVSHAQNSANCLLSGRWAEGECYAVCADGTTAYYANGGVLEIVDYSDAVHPLNLGRFICNGEIRNIRVINNRAFLVGGYNGFLKILDVSDPTTPIEVGYLDIPQAYDVALSGDYGYVTSRDNGLYIIDLSNLDNPIVLSRIDHSGYFTGIEVKDDIAYVAGSFGFSVIDVADKENPVIVQDFELEGTCRGVEIYQNTLFIGGLYYGLHMYNLGPTLSFIGTYDIGGHAEDVMIKDGVAYVANRYDGVYFLDVTDPQAPVLLGQHQTRRAACIFVNSTYVYVADTWAFHIIDATDLENPISIEDKNMANDITSFALADDLLYTSNIYRGMHILDVNDPTSPEIMSLLNLSGTHLDIKIKDTLAFLAGGNSGLILISVKYPETPWRISSLQFITSITCLAIQDQYVYAGVISEGMHIIDISDPTDPTETGFIKYDAEILNIIPDGDRAYVLCEGEGVYVVDVSDPTMPVQLGYYETQGHPENMMILGDRAYLAEGTRGLTILDISSPEIPTHLITYDSENYLNDVAVRGHYAYLADGHAGIRVLDIWNIEQIEEVAFYETGEDASQIILGEEHIYIADSYDGVYIFQFDSLSVSVKETGTHGFANELIQSVYPNPSNSTTKIELIPQALQDFEIMIYNTKGGVMKKIDPSTNYISHTIEWDGLSNDGQKVPAGIYILEVISGDRRQAKEFIRIE